MALTLSLHKRRVVGVLMEKALSTPDQYPLTLNSLVSGCNQKSNRDPQLEMTRAAVEDTLDDLREQGLVIFVDREGARTRRYKTTARIELALASEKDMAVIAELLLRGFGTLNELVRRASRMRHSIDTSEMEGLLEAFTQRETPLIKKLPRAPGQKEPRYTHCLWGEGEEPEPPTGTSSPRVAAARNALQSEVETLRVRQAELEARLEALNARVAELEGR